MLEGVSGISVLFQRERSVAEQKAERHLARNSIIVLAVLVGLYALAGFLLLPWWLEKALPEQLEQRMGWQAQVESIRVNPFALDRKSTRLNSSHVRISYAV